MSSFLALGPIVLVVLGALVVLLLSAFLKKGANRLVFGCSLGFLLASIAACVLLWNRGARSFGGMLEFDRFALFFALLLLCASALVVLLARHYVSSFDLPSGEFHGLLLLATAGVLIMTSSPSLVVIFLGLEVTSISSYALAGLNRADERSTEAAAKYFLIGSFAGAFLVFGLAVLFGATGTLDIPAIVASFEGQAGPALLGWVGIGLVLVGFAFKVALVPFHMWAPDVVHGAPTPVAVFFILSPKAAAFGVLFRLLAPLMTSRTFSSGLFAAFQAVAALTIVLGTVTALRQNNVKRMLVYSSIANSGYMLLALLAGDGVGLGFFLGAYLFMSLGAFGSLAALGSNGREYHELEDFAGLGRRSPWVAGLMAVFLISLAGFPPTGGFLAKFFVFVTAVRRGLTPLVVLAVLASLVSVYYYLRVVVAMYMRDPAREVLVDSENGWLLFALVLCLLGVLQLGLFPGSFLQLVKTALPGPF
jgi:NADH-quinone oxidoreductase subunit N